VRFFNAVDLVNQLGREKQQGKAGNLANGFVAGGSSSQSIQPRTLARQQVPLLLVPSC